jgi:hypothetical protein
VQAVIDGPPKLAATLSVQGGEIKADKKLMLISCI